jgi:sec-independent protein translocase protein TatA
MSGGPRNEMPMIGVLESEWGIIIILVVVVLVFGSSQLPKLARSLGSAQSEFKKGLSEGKKGDGADADADADKAAPGDAAAKDSDKPSAASG